MSRQVIDLSDVLFFYCIDKILNNYRNTINTNNIPVLLYLISEMEAAVVMGRCDVLLLFFCTFLFTFHFSVIV